MRIQLLLPMRLECRWRSGVRSLPPSASRPHSPASSNRPSRHPSKRSQPPTAGSTRLNSTAIGSRSISRMKRSRSTLGAAMTGPSASGRSPTTRGQEHQDRAGRLRSAVPRSAETAADRAKQVKDVVVKYLKDNPADRHLAGIALAYRAFYVAFDCKPKPNTN